MLPTHVSLSVQFSTYLDITLNWLHTACGADFYSTDRLDL